jgi:hypothetical protein
VGSEDAVIPGLAEDKAEDVLPPPLRRWNTVTLDPSTAGAAAWRALLMAIRAKLAEAMPERTARIVDLPYPANPFFTGRATTWCASMRNCTRHPSRH